MTPKLEEIYNKAFDLIEIRLNKREQVYPFTVRVAIGEEPIISMLDSADNALEAVKDLREEMKSLTSEGNIEALAICCDMHITDPRSYKEIDAILVELASKEGESKNIYIPYNFDDEEVIKKPFEIPSEETYF